MDITNRSMLSFGLIFLVFGFTFLVAGIPRGKDGWQNVIAGLTFAILGGLLTARGL